LNDAARRDDKRPESTWAAAEFADCRRDCLKVFSTVIEARKVIFRGEI